MTTLPWRCGAIALCLASSVFAAPAAGPAYGSFGIDLEARAPAIRPGDDFWSHANGGWSRRTAIEAGSDAVGVSVDMRARVDGAVRRIVEDMADRRDTEGDGARIGALYRSWMDEAGIRERGVAVLAPWLARIDAAAGSADINNLFASPGYASPVAVDAEPSPADPARFILTLGQGALGMPREFFLDAGARQDQVRTAYRAYVRTLLDLAGMADAGARADAIVSLETAMARAHWSLAESRDLGKMNDFQPVSGLQAMLPGFDWERLLAPYGLAPDTAVLVQQNTALAALGRLLASTPLQSWKDYLRYHFIADHADCLPPAFAEARFAFHDGMLSGMKARPERWKRGIQLVNGILGDAVGRLYVERHYPPAAGRQIRELTEDLRAAYRERIGAARWMDAPTRRAALAKLEAMKLEVGGPRRYVDYASLRIEPDDLLGNLVRADEFARGLRIRRLHEPADAGLWVTTPQQMNAFYDWHNNAIVFPAAVLQAPLFDPQADAAVNYGAIGVLIGHEMGHAFDDQGRQFGADGRMRDWWTARSAQAFERRAAALAGQYDAYEVLPGARVNGKLTLGENIADLSGVEAAYAAYQRYQARHGKAPLLSGLSGEQRFFLAYAQGRRTRIQDEALRQLLVVDTHAPSVFRVNGALRNMDAWYRAFGVKPGDALYLAPAQRIYIW